MCNRKGASMMTRRRFLIASAGTALVSYPSQAWAEVIAKGARMLVGFPAGGSVDFVARLLVDQMHGYAASMIVDNHAGAGGRAALDALKSGAADGSVIALTPGDQITLFPHVYKKLGYDPLRDFVPVMTVCTVQFLLTVGPMVPATVTTLSAFVDWCRANPKLATYGTPGTGSRPHFLGAALARAGNFEFVHLPYKGAAPAIQDLLGGQIPATVNVISNSLPHIQAGTLRALATTAPNRSPLLPNVPTMREAGYPQLEALEWFGVFVPAATPEQTVIGLKDAVDHAVATAVFKTGLGQQSFEPAGSSGREFAQLIKSDTERWGDVVKASGFKPIE
jgi:tripartite-type tricarboxylate transporter receptor subunit TctC